ncbi:MAG: hypothetical protein JSU87_15520 [Gemmatimonadota bacterium]|nr:MAG: hypothetical protein JSU87_15520 [Gemmatimonadota bacterium]
MPKKVHTAKRRFAAPSGREWEAEICLHSGDNAQSPHLMVIFRDPVRGYPDRYNLLPPGSPKVPRQAAKQMSDDDLRALLRRSVPMRRRTS